MLSIGFSKLFSLVCVTRQTCDEHFIPIVGAMHAQSHCVTYAIKECSCVLRYFVAQHC